MSVPHDPQNPHDPQAADRPTPPSPNGPSGHPQQFPSYPQQYADIPPQYGWVGGVFRGGTAPQPGSIPLRPLSVGEILGAGARIARAHGAALVVLSLVLGVLANGISLGLTALTGSLSELITGRWAVDLVEGRRTTLPTGVWVNLLSGLLLGLVSFAIVYGVATAVVTRSVLGQRLDGIVKERLAGRWPTLLAVAALVSVLSTLGLILFIVPGVLLYLVWVVAMPVAVMERTGVGKSLQRSVELTRGFKGRIFGVLIAWFGIDLGVGLVVNSLVQKMLAFGDATTFFVVQLCVTLLLTSLFQAWLAAMVAVIYVDLRIRKENLGPALAAAAAQNPGPTEGPTPRSVG